VIYRTNPKNGDKLSQLGFGCMRFPKDDSELLEVLGYAIEHGVNFFDTAYIYPHSEQRLGECLKKLGARERVKIATKLPPWKCKSYDDFDKIFEIQLQRLQTDYIDYYFIHSLTSLETWLRMKELGVLKWIDEKKASGKIKNIGFSFHGGRDDFIKITDDFNWEFLMIQYNYLDENSQAGKHGLQYAAQKGIPVIAMEPVRGGQLANNVPKQVLKLFDEMPNKLTPVDWALRWVLNHKEVTCLISGMGNMQMLKENLKTASEASADAFGEAETKLFEKVRNEVTKKIRVHCTGCGYCMPCPKGVDIAACFACLNEIPLSGKVAAIKQYLLTTTLKTKPSNASLCINCAKCEDRCPQVLPIMDKLKEVKKALEPFYYKPVRFVAKKILKIK
jgi:hypothetical protein